MSVATDYCPSYSPPPYETTPPSSSSSFDCDSSLFFFDPLTIITSNRLELTPGCYCDLPTSSHLIGLISLKEPGRSPDLLLALLALLFLSSTSYLTILPSLSARRSSLIPLARTRHRQLFCSKFVALGLTLYLGRIPLWRAQSIQPGRHQLPERAPRPPSSHAARTRWSLAQQAIPKGSSRSSFLDHFASVLTNFPNCPR